MTGKVGDDLRGLEGVAIFILDERFHRGGRTVELLVERDKLEAESLRPVGIDGNEPDIFSFLANGHDHGLAVVECLGLAIEHVVGRGSGDDDVKAGERPGKASGHLGLTLDHQHLEVAPGLEIGQNRRQSFLGALISILGQEIVLAGSLSRSSRSGSITAVTPSLIGPAATIRLAPKPQNPINLKFLKKKEE